MTAAPALTARSFRVTGTVQGVGFRPHVYRLAERHSLCGWVRNVAGIVEIHVEGGLLEVDAFERALSHDAPAAARVESVEAAAAAACGLEDFTILASTDTDSSRPVTPDLAICGDCLRELFDPTDRRYLHPFITCTNCGPRYTIVHALPYDRERTSMAAFPMCERCEREYSDPADRRYHAETVACPSCGPEAWLVDARGTALSGHSDAIRHAAEELRKGAIVAVRGIGGFHVACDATSEAAVQRLRDRKRRDGKPFAVMVRTVSDAGVLGFVGSEEERLLAGPDRPIVLLETRAGSTLAPSVSPGLDRVGVMLAYTPLHHLLLTQFGGPLVMTSGNLSDEPIAIGNDEARLRLREIADLFLLHDREILSRVDDSVARVVDGCPVLLRCARGFAPHGLPLPIAAPRPLLAVGPHLKNTFTLADGRTAHVSPHIGDLDGVESLEHFQAALIRYQELFRIRPQVAVRDLHQGYLSSRIAEQLGLPEVIAVQHHHAHVAAVAAEHGVTGPVVGLAFDGTGLGADGRVWGAEIMIASLTGYHRVGHLRYVPLPGGDRASREAWRVVLGYQSLAPEAAGDFALAFGDVPEESRALAERQIERRLNAPQASSMGRLFDAASAILGLRRIGSYEGQIAMELETVAGRIPAAPLPMPLRETAGGLELDPVPLLAMLGERRQRGTDVGLLAACFHESVVAAAVRMAVAAADGAGIGVAVLSGGSFQNARLLSGVRRGLEERGLRVLLPRQLGPNDGAISYGQAAIAAALLAQRA